MIRRFCLAAAVAVALCPPLWAEERIGDEDLAGLPIVSLEIVRLQIFDLRGRLVTTLVDEVRPTGRHEVVWAGTDDTGRRVASGTYVCRMQAGGFTGTTRMMLVK